MSLPPPGAEELETAVNELAALCKDHEQQLDQAKVAVSASRRKELNEAGAGAIECSLMRERARTLIEELERGFLEKFATEFAAVADDLVTALDGRDRALDDTRLAELRSRAEKDW